MASLLLIAATAVPAAAAHPMSVVGSSAVGGQSQAHQRRSAAYWTPRRMRSARVAVVPQPTRRSPRTGLSDEVGQRPHLVSGSVPGDTTIPVADPTPTEYDYPFPYTRYAVEREVAAVAPYKAIGKVFFRQDGVDYVCSGASVVGGSRQVVYTAGHCLSDGAGSFSRKVVFVPGYRNGTRPYGTFAYNNLWVPSLWHTNGDFTYDLGAFDVSRNAGGKKLGWVVGKLGFASDLSRDVHWNAFGYPAEYPFAGERLQVCQASHATDDLSTSGVGPDTMALGCDMTGGSSGGPWIFRLRRGDYLNGLNSYGYHGEPESMYGPYFGAMADHIRCVAGTGDINALTC